jgi:hypothetical protein
VGIDDALVMETKEEIFEMNNGCICCTGRLKLLCCFRVIPTRAQRFWWYAVRGDLIRILSKLLKRKNKLDAIMIETTGLANPAPVIQTFFVDDDIKDACLLDAVLTVVDAKHITLHLDDEKPDDVVNEAGEQACSPSSPFRTCRASLTALNIPAACSATDRVLGQNPPQQAGPCLCGREENGGGQDPGTPACTNGNSIMAVQSVSY